MKHVSEISVLGMIIRLILCSLEMNMYGDVKPAVLLGSYAFHGMQVSAFGGDEQTDTGDYWR